VNSLAVSGTTVCAGGGFTSIGGQNRSHIAALDAGTGLATPWNPGANGAVECLAVSGATVYAGGSFTSIGGRSRSGIAAIGPADATAPTVQVLSPNGGSPHDDRLVIGSQRQLRWSATDNLAVQSVDLYLSRTGSSGPWTLLAAGAPNTGSYVWTVTGPEVTGNNAYLKAVARDYGGNLGNDSSDGGFNVLTTVTAVEPNAGVDAFALGAPAPNPAAGRSLLTFAIPTRTPVHLSLLDVQGREVELLADGVREPGRYTAALEASDLRAGIYFVRMQAGSMRLTRRVVVIK
jgi:hypothetical protein